MAFRRAATRKAPPAWRARLEHLRDVGLFRDLDATRLASLERLARSDSDDDDPPDASSPLAHILELHLTEPRPRNARSADPFVLAPQSLSDLQALGVPIRVVKDPIEPDVEHVIFPDGRRIIYDLGETHADAAATYDAVLAAVGDERRSFPIAAADFEEPVYLLANPAQMRALDRARVRDPGVEVGAVEVVDVVSYAKRVATTLADVIGAEVEVHEGAVIVDLDRKHALAFADRVRGVLPIVGPSLRPKPARSSSKKFSTKAFEAKARPSMKHILLPRAGDKGAHFAGSTSNAIIINERGATTAYDIATGKQQDKVPRTFAAAKKEAARQLTIGRTKFVVTSADDDGLALHLGTSSKVGPLVRALSKDALWVAAGSLLALVDVDRHDPRHEEARSLFLVAQDGASVALRDAPSWLLRSESRLLSAPDASAIVLVGDEGVAWIPWTTLGSLFRARGEVELSAAIETDDEVGPTVTRVRLPGQPGIVPENTILLTYAGWHAMVESPRASTVSVGDQLLVKKTNGVPELFDAKGNKLGSGGNLDQLFRASRTEEARLSSTTASVEHLALPQERAADLRGPKVMDTLERLRAVGIAADLEGSRLDLLTLRFLVYDARSPRDEKVRCLLAAYWTKWPPAPTEALHRSAPHRWTELFGKRKDVDIRTTSSEVSVRSAALEGTYVAGSVRSDAAIANLVLATIGDARRYRTHVVDDLSNEVVALLLSPVHARAVEKLLPLEPPLAAALDATVALTPKSIEAMVRALVPEASGDITVSTRKPTGLRMSLSPLAAAFVARALRR